MKFINRLRHWQLFVILLVGPLAVSIIDVPGPTNVKTVSDLVAFILYTVWVWSVGYELSSTPQSKRILTLFIFVLLLSFVMATRLPEADYGFLRMVFTAATYLFLLLCTFVTGRLLSLAEALTGRRRHPFLNGLLMLVFPVGVWIIQPQINEIVKIDSSNSHIPTKN